MNERRWGERHHDRPEDDPWLPRQDDDSQGVEGLVVTERDDYRLAALEGAIRLAEHSTTWTTRDVLDCADALYLWLLEVTLELDVVSVTEQGSGLPVQIQFTPGGALQLTDTQQFTASVVAKDAKGNDVPDTLTWASDDNGAVVTLAPSADTLSCLIVAVAPGTANYTATDASGLSVSGQAVVGAGAPADLVLTEGAPEAQPAAAPAAPAAPAPS